MYMNMKLLISTNRKNKMARTVLGKNPIYFKFAQKDFSDSDKAPNASFYTRLVRL